jgi:HlyD family secretion protein
MKTRALVVVLGLAGLAVAAHQAGFVIFPAEKAEAESKAKAAAASGAPVPAVSVVQATKSDFVETVLVTGSFVAREEILVAPEVDGLRVLELRAEEGDSVKKGDVLAVLVTEQLEAQLAANEAALGSARANIERAKSSIAEMEARLAEARAQLERARPLVKDKYLSESVYDQREAAAKAAESQLASARGGLAQAEAEKIQVEAQRRELIWRRGNAEVRAPATGVISRRGARIGGLALGNSLAGGDAMFRIIENGDIELDAEVPETHLPKVKSGQKARIVSSGGTEVTGTVRLVSAEVDKATRLGHVRIFIGNNPALKIGAFGRGTIETARDRTIAVPLSAVLYSEDGASVQAVVDGKVVTRQVKTGLETAGMIAIVSGLSEGDVIVSKAGTFLRNGDAVRPVQPAAKISEAGE